MYEKIATLQQSGETTFLKQCTHCVNAFQVRSDVFDKMAAGGHQGYAALGGLYTQSRPLIPQMYGSLEFQQTQLPVSCFRKSSFLSLYKSLSVSSMFFQRTRSVASWEIHSRVHKRLFWKKMATKVQHKIDEEE